MAEVIYIDEWSAIHIIAGMSIGMFMSARNYGYITSLAVVTTAGLVWEMIEYVSHESEEILQDQATDMLLNTIGLSIGYLLGRELKKK